MHMATKRSVKYHNFYILQKYIKIKCNFDDLTSVIYSKIMKRKIMDEDRKRTLSARAVRRPTFNSKSSFKAQLVGSFCFSNQQLNELK